MSEGFIEKEKKKKLVKTQQKLQRIEEETWWDTILHFLVTNWVTVVLILSVIAYKSYVNIADYIEDRRIKERAMAELEFVKDRSEKLKKDIEEFHNNLENLRKENASLRKKIEQLTPSEKTEIIKEQILKLSEKLKILEEKSVRKKIEERLLRLKTRSIITE